MVLTGKPKYSEKNLSQCHFFRHKFHMDLGSNPGICDEKSATNQCSILISIYTLLLPEGQTGKAWEAFKKQCFRKSGIME